MFDTLIRNGTVIDGTGAQGVAADVGIVGDRIRFIGKANGTPAKKTIDVTGCVVAPGFVDCHSHADLTIYKGDHKNILAPLIRQGITTFVGGNCGMSLAPVSEKHAQQTQDYLEAFTAMDFSKEVRWKTTAEFMEIVEKQGLVMNAALLAPHGLIRIDAMGLDCRAATDEEIRSMTRLLEQCMEEGCIGLSTGLQYFPGMMSETRELIELGKVLKKYDGIFTSHLRSYSNTLDEAIGEVIEVSKVNEIRGQVSHIFWVPDMGFIGKIFRPLVRGLARLGNHYVVPIPLDTEVAKQLDRLSDLRDRGVRVGMDVMPTTTGFTHLLAFFPPWVLTDNREAILNRLKSRETRERILKDILGGKMVWPHTESNTWSLNLFKVMGWECARIMSVVSEKNKEYEGMNLVAIGKKLGKHPLDAACDLLIEEDGKVLVFESMAQPDDNFTERSMYAPLKHPEVSVSTDTILMGFGKPSSLFYSCYPKFLSRYIRQKKMLSLETGVRKVSGLPAEHFNLKDRGILKENAFADITVFNPNTIASRSTFEKPDEKPEGIDHVFINGGHVVERGTVRTELMAGRLLKRN